MWMNADFQRVRFLVPLEWISRQRLEKRALIICHSVHKQRANMKYTRIKFKGGRGLNLNTHVLCGEKNMNWCYEILLSSLGGKNRTCLLWPPLRSKCTAVHPPSQTFWTSVLVAAPLSFQLQTNNAKESDVYQRFVFVNFLSWSKKKLVVIRPG